MIDADVFKPCLAHEGGDIVRREELKVVFGDCVLAHLLGRADRDCRPSARFQHTIDFRHSFCGLSPEVDRVDGEYAIEGLVGKGELAYVSWLQAQSALSYVSAEPALRLAQGNIRNINARDGPLGDPGQQLCQADASAKADFENVMMGLEVQQIES